MRSDDLQRVRRVGLGWWRTRGLIAVAAGVVFGGGGIAGSVRHRAAYAISAQFCSDCYRGTSVSPRDVCSFRVSR